jgi:diguanylate cyclase (GGDEF)-like protein
VSFRLSQFLRQLFFPNGVLILAGIGALALFTPPAGSSLRLVSGCLAIAAGLLAIRLHSLRAFLITLAIASALLVTTSSATTLSHPLVVLLLACDFALVLLVEDTFFDWEAVGWWCGLLGVQWVALVITSRWSPSFVADVARQSLDLVVVKVGMVEIGTAVVLMMLFLRFMLSLDAVAAGMVWALAALVAGARTNAQDAHTGLALFALGIAAVERSHWIAYHDELTGLPGRRAFNEALASLREQYSIAIVDVDHFKQFNDTFGHDTGDQVLRKVARQLAEVGGGGTAYRCGGEEFAVLFPHHRTQDAATHAEDLRQGIEADVFVARGPARSQRERDDRRSTHTRRKQPAPVVTRVTVSIGLAESTEHTRSTEEVLLAADKALYQAKHNGRNRVEIASVPPTRTRRTPVAQAARPS